ncbi:MAG: hypothetical protein V4690_02060 [Patescibacteria group bacterium]
MLSKNLPHREEYVRKKRKQRIITYSLFSAFFLLVVGVASYISHRPELRVTSVVLNGEVLVSESEVVAVTKDYVSGSYFFLFPKNNTFWYPQKKLTNLLKDTFKRIDTIDVELDGPNTIVIDITERKPVAIWDNGTEGTYFMDMNGTIFSSAPTFSGNAYLKYYGLVEGDPIGQQYIAPEDFHKITEFIESVKTNSVYPVHFIAKTKDSFSLVLSGGTEVYFDNKVSLDVLAENFKALLKTPELAVQKDGSILAEYIDLRFGNKLFYKLRDTNTQANESL